MAEPSGWTITEIQALIDLSERSFLIPGLSYVSVTAEDLLSYFDGPAPSGDMTTVEDILDNRWLLFHELIEISELKKAGFDISVNLLFTQEQAVNRAHIRATEVELDSALRENDLDWIAERLQDIRGWLEDETLAFDLKQRCEAMLQLYQFRA